MLYKETKKFQKIGFTSNDSLSLGIEIEMQIIDKKSLNLAPRFKELAAACKDPKRLTAEFYLSTAEINGLHKCDNVAEITQDFEEAVTQALTAAKKIKVELAATGCHPFSKYNDCLISPSKRYDDLVVRNQWISRRMTVYGLHIHLGMKSGDDCIEFSNFFFHFMPHLLALSASSPFWQGDDTGLSSCRPTTYESLPTAGQPYIVKNWEEFQELYQSLIKCGAINSMKDLWWDMRPSPIIGTLEIRVCDGCATLEEAYAVTAFAHLLAIWFEENRYKENRFSNPIHWIVRENKWRAIRYGLDADLVVDAKGNTIAIKDDIRNWLKKLAPLAKKMKYENYMKTVADIVTKGNSAQRQLRVFKKTNSIEEVVKFNIEEFKNRKPIWD